MRIQSGQLISLGYGKFVRSDDVVAIEPIVDGRGPGRRTLVWVRGIQDPLIASRAETSLVEDMTTPPEQIDRLRHIRDVQKRIVSALEKIPSVLHRVISEEAGVKLSDLIDEARRASG